MLVVFVTGAREIHPPPGVDLQQVRALRDQVEHWGERPLISPGADRDERDQGVLLLRLDRTLEAVRQRIAEPIEFTFVLTRQDDDRFSRSDTVHLRPLLRRWCRERDVDYNDLLIVGPPHQLDSAARQLTEALARDLAEEPAVVLVTGGGPAALQVAAHFSVFQGMRRRESITVLQLEEVRDEAGTIIDTRVREVHDFHGLVSLRGLHTQARELIDDLDLAGAVQVVLAGHDDVDDPAYTLARTLEKQLGRQLPSNTPLDSLSLALDLAELEASRPGGAPAMAQWYAWLIATELIPAAVAHAHPDSAAAGSAVADSHVRALNAALAGDDKEAPAARLTDAQMSPQFFRERGAPMLSGGPSRLRIGPRAVTLSDLLPALILDSRQTRRTLIWLALLDTVRQARNEAAHDLIAAGPAEHRRTIRALSERLLDNIDRLDPAPVVTCEPERWAAIRRALREDRPKQAETSRRGRRSRRSALQRAIDDPSQATSTTDEQLATWIDEPTLPAQRFAAVRAGRPLHGRIVKLLDEADAANEDWRPGITGDPMSMAITLDAPSSPFRQLVRLMVSTVPPDNQLIKQGLRLRHALTGDGPA